MANEFDEFAQFAIQCRAETVNRLQRGVVRRTRPDGFDGRSRQAGPRCQFGIGEVFASPPVIGAHGITELDDNHLTTCECLVL